MDGAHGGGSVPSGELQQSSSAGRAQGLPPNLARKGGKNSAVMAGGLTTKSAAPVEDMSIDVDNLVFKLKTSGITEAQLHAKFKATQ